MSIDEIIKKYGEPDDAIICDPTRGNEAQGIVLIYSSTPEPFIFYEESTLPIKSIEDITVKNINIPYLPNDYSIMVSTNDTKHPTLRIHAGTDSGWAEEVCQQLICALQTLCKQKT